MNMIIRYLDPKGKFKLRRKSLCAQAGSNAIGTCLLRLGLRPLPLTTQTDRRGNLHHIGMYRNIMDKKNGNHHSN